MSNKRVSELSLINATDVAPYDLFFIADVSAIESKRIYASQLATYVSGFVSASLSASTATNATTAKTASYLIGSGLVYGTPALGTASYALTSSWNISSSHAIRADTASYALAALSASYSKTSSYAQTASFAFTSSYVVITEYSSAYADYARTASHLLYNGIPNGTASYAMNLDETAIVKLANTAQYANYLLYTGIDNGTAYQSILARTSSYLIGTSLVLGTPAIGTSSYAISASTAKTASYIRTIYLSASYLRYTPNVTNGTVFSAVSSSWASGSVTSSHALTASYLMGFSGVLSNNYSEGGTYDGTTYDPTPGVYATATASFGTLTINPSDNIAKKTIIECWGNIEVTTAINQILQFQLVQGAITVPLDTATINAFTGGFSTGWYFKKEYDILGSWEVRVVNNSGNPGVMTGRTPRMYIKTLSDVWSVT